MKQLTPEFGFDFDGISKKLGSLASEAEADVVDASDVRKRLEAAGFAIKKTEANAPNEASFLAADSSFAKHELRFNVLWGVHAACVHGVFDGDEHADTLSGRGSVPYKKLSYDSRADFGWMKPYASVDERLDAIRVANEARLLNETVDVIQRDGGRVDYVLFDGSIATIEFDENLPESAAVREELTRLKQRNLVGLVEDSHETDISRKLGLEYTNALILDAALTPFEYVAQDKDALSVCYIKLPAKRMDYLGGKESRPIIARWEFKRGEAERQLPEILGVWLSEKDVYHPQTYPVRAADYLTRKLNVHGILENFAAEKNLLAQFRSMREG